MASKLQYSSLPLEVLSMKVSASTKLVAQALIYFGRQGNCHPRVATVASYVGMSVRTVHRALRLLKELKLLGWYRTGRASRYTVKGILCALAMQLMMAKGYARRMGFAVARRLICQGGGSIEEGILPGWLGRPNYAVKGA